MKLLYMQKTLFNAVLGIVLEIVYTAAIMLVSFVVCLALYFRQWS